ncbi:MAG: stalk domain-containing protein [Clostridia bacterium]|jgi:beta-lactamase superfamily II metal-dependent hydrolase|nr:stalk domain-containing protein [Clostridia bacterium]
MKTINFKKLFMVTILSVAVFVVGSSISCTASAKSGINVEIDGKFTQFKTDLPFIDGAGRTQVPLRQTAESYGCSVKWDSDSKTAYISKAGKSVEVPVGKNYIVSGGAKKETDTKAMISGGRIYMPIRAVLQEFGADVHWDSVNHNVIIDSPNAKLLNVYFEDVGQGDSTFIDFGNYEILIDAGTKDHGDTVVKDIKPYVDGNLDLVIATHTDADHIGGLPAVFEAFQVGEVIDNGDSVDTNAYKNFKTAVKNEPNCKEISDDDMTFNIGSDAEIKIIETGDNNGSENANSVVTLLKYKNVSALFAGDMTKNVEKKCLSKFSDIDVFKASHHGSKESNSEEFLSVIKPEYVVVSAGEDNSYGHPSKEALQRFFNEGATVFGTFKDSTVKMTTDGGGYYFNTNDKLTLNDAGAKNNYNNSDSYKNPNTYSSPSTNSYCSKSEAAYIGNLSTKKFHRLTCPYAAKINESNIVYFASKSDAEDAGYSACKVCKP